LGCALAPPPCGRGVAYPLEISLSLTRYPAEFGRSMSNGTSVIKKISLEKWPLASRLSGSLKVIETDTDWSAATYDFLSKFQSNDGPISHRFRDERRFQLKITNFSHPRVFNAPMKGFPLEVGIGAWGQKTRIIIIIIELSYPSEKEVWRYLQRSRYNPPTWQTDRRTPDDSNDRAYA